MMRAPAPASSDPATGRSLSLLSCNILAGGSVKRYRDYVTGSWKQVLPHGKRENLDGLARLLGEFDLVGLQEADAGSLRSGFLNQTQYLAEAAHFPFWTHQPNRRVSKLATSSNGLLAREEPREVLDYPLPGRIPGRGALWVRFGNGADELIVVVAHLSLGAQARARQVAFLAELLDGHAQAVLMGDLNTSAQSRELAPLFRQTSLVMPEELPATFPSWQPKRAIDHILVSRSITVEARWALSHPVSDHLPIAARIRVPASLPRS
ncbi:endonuclease/exonuclease/phosphatase family protein [Dokdonella sp.]|uniref:endonuclease/exonuclease/phosphatase family protein n=1 Tax=Dokdonella sp. TaxID=2291710 RepID=UPI0025C6C576|nr:endonuclease/exonuclease/phosphatase family protein [Dokdonella sp.]MBX3690193.1 endonuclease/exonuclease/phosphatase family protein [Dokdonella sp.]